LGESEGLGTEIAAKGLLLAVDVVVSLEGELSGEFLPAIGELTFEGLFLLHVYLYNIDYNLGPAYIDN